MARLGPACRGGVGLGEPRQGVAWRGEVRQGLHQDCGSQQLPGARRRWVRLAVARHVEARLGVAWRGGARQGRGITHFETGRGNARQATARLVRAWLGTAGAP